MNETNPEQADESENNKNPNVEKTTCRRLKAWCPGFSLAAVIFLVGIGVGMYTVPDPTKWSHGSLFMGAQGLLALVVLLFLPLLARCQYGTSVESKELRGLNLPRGSVRAMLALWIVGSYLIVLVFAVLDNKTNETLKTVITAFGPLVGATIAFYFAGRSASPPPKDDNSKGLNSGDTALEKPKTQPG